MTDKVRVGVVGLAKPRFIDCEHLGLPLRRTQVLLKRLVQVGVVTA